MARPLRIEFAGALYHVTTRGNGREPIVVDDDDRQQWLVVLGEVCAQWNWSVHAYCLMDNHYHLFIETRDGSLSRGMRQLNRVDGFRSCVLPINYLGGSFSSKAKGKT